MGDPVYPFALPPEDEAAGELLTELRIHGVSGPDPASVLEASDVFHVAGDGITGFARRLSGDGYGAIDQVDEHQPLRRLEAFSWRGVSSGAASRSLWLLLAPFALLNVAAWMHPIPPEVGDEKLRGLPRRDPWRDPWVLVLNALLRAMALGFTLLLMLSTLAATEDIPYRSTRIGCPSSWSAAGCTRVYRGGGLAVAALAVLLLHRLARATWQRYEARDPKGGRQNYPTPLSAACFWSAKNSVRRQQWLHVATALGLIAWVGVQPSLHHQRWLSLAVLIAGVTVASAVACLPPFSLASDLGAADPMEPEAAAAALALGGAPAGGNEGPTSPYSPIVDSPRWWTKFKASRTGAVLGGVLLLVIAVAIGWAAVVLQHKAFGADHRTVVPPDVDPFRMRPALTVLLIALLAEMVAVALVVWVMRRRAPVNRNHRPMLGGWATALVPPVAFLTAAVLSSGVIVAASKLFDHQSQHVITPGFYELANVGATVVLVTLALTGAFMLVFWLTSRWRFNPLVVEQRVRHERDQKDYRNACGTAHVTRSGYRAVPLLSLGGLSWLAIAAIVVLTGARPYAARFPLALFAMAIAALPGLFLTLFRNAGSRRKVGVLWDVVTFWPRAAHPFGPPCYAERVVPQLVTRMEALRTKGPVLISGHSQGAMISSALVQQLSPETLARTALMTYGCQLSFLFARAFPSYCGGFALDQVAADLAVPAASDPRPSRWLNLFRLTDVLGSTVFLSEGYADVNREVADPRYARYIRTDDDHTDIPRLSLQTSEGPISGDLITDTHPLGHSDYFASYEYRVAAHLLDATLVPKPTTVLPNGDGRQQAPSIAVDAPSR